MERKELIYDFKLKKPTAVGYQTVAQLVPTLDQRHVCAGYTCLDL